MANIAWKIAKPAVGVISGVAATQLSKVAWKILTPKVRPNKKGVDAPLRDVVAFAALSAVVGTVVTVAMNNATAKWLGVDTQA